MPTKGNPRRIASKTPYDIYKEAALMKNTRERKSGRFRKRFSAKLRFALVFRLALLFCSGVWLPAGAAQLCWFCGRGVGGGALRRARPQWHLPPTRHGAKLPNQLF